MGYFLNGNSNKEILGNQFFAFNVWDINSAKAVIDASLLKRKWAFLQVSSKLFPVIDKEEFLYVIRRYARINEVKTIVHLDHCRDIDQIKEAVEYGWDSVMYDGSPLSIDENIKMTNEVSKICKIKNVLLEAEIGQVKGTEDDIAATDASAVDIRDVVRFIEKTEVDMLAVAIGTSHGQYRDEKIEIDYKMIKKVGRITNTPFVIHGGSELPKEILKKLFSFSNVKKINISTDLKQAYRKGILSAVNNGLLNEGGFDAFRVEGVIFDHIKKLTLEKLEILEG